MNARPAARHKPGREASPLAAEIARWASDDGDLASAVHGLSLHRRSEPTQPFVCFYQPSLAVIAQGAKRVEQAGDTYVYNPDTYLLTSVDLPVVSHVTEASSAEPYLALVLALDPREIALVLADAQLPRGTAAPGPMRGMAVSPLDSALQDAIVRLVKLLEEPASIPILAPLIQREITYRLLVGEQSARLRHIAAAGSQGQQITKAIAWLKLNFRSALRIESLAREVGMSASTFHHHFRALTGMSPLQYQKHLRLQEARRLMLTDATDAATAANEVGHESASQFSREYSRAFGAPPVRDVARLRQLA